MRCNMYKQLPALKTWVSGGPNLGFGAEKMAGLPWFRETWLSNHNKNFVIMYVINATRVSKRLLTAQQNGITYVLNVSTTSPRPPFIQEGHFLRIPVNDSYCDKLLPFFHESFQFLGEQCLCTSLRCKLRAVIAECLVVRSCWLGHNEKK